MRKETGWSKLKWIMILGFSGVLLSYFIWGPKRVSVDASQVVLGSLEERIQTDGFLRAKQRETLTSPADGNMKRMPLEIGDVVKKGQIVSQLYWNIDYEPIRAPMSGVVSKVYRESAGPIRRGDPIIEIVDPNELEVVATPLTSDAARVPLGACVLVMGFEKKGRCTGRVSRISKAGFVKISALGVDEERTEVVVTLNDSQNAPVGKMGNQYHVDLNILISEFKDILKIPVGALIRSGQDWAVFKVVEEHAKLTPIQVGQRSSQEVVVVSGLKERDWVILFPGDAIRDGAKLRVNARGP